MRTALVFLLIACILCFNFVLFYLLGIPKLFRKLVENHKKKQRAKPKQEWIEMQSDVQQRAKERRRKEEKQRWERNAARKRSGFYAELEQAYNKA
jgi:flagellar biosynthesis component FlhA